MSSLSGRIDSLMSESTTGISGLWSNFFDSVSALSSNASAPAERQNMLGQANALTTRFQQLQGQFDRLSTDVNSGLAASAWCGAWQKMQTWLSIDARTGPVPPAERLCGLSTTLVGWPLAGSAAPRATMITAHRITGSPPRAGT